MPCIVYDVALGLDHCRLVHLCCFNSPFFESGFNSFSLSHPEDLAVLQKELRGQEIVGGPHKQLVQNRLRECYVGEMQGMPVSQEKPF